MSDCDADTHADANSDRHKYTDRNTYKDVHFDSDRYTNAHTNRLRGDANESLLRPAGASGGQVHADTNGYVYSGSPDHLHRGVHNAASGDQDSAVNGDIFIGITAVILDLALLPSFHRGKRPAPITALGYMVATLLSVIGFGQNGQWFPFWATLIGCLEWTAMFILSWRDASRARREHGRHDYERGFPGS